MSHYVIPVCKVAPSLHRVTPPSSHLRERDTKTGKRDTLPPHPISSSCLSLRAPGGGKRARMRSGETWRVYALPAPAAPIATVSPSMIRVKIPRRLRVENARFEATVRVRRQWRGGCGAVHFFCVFARWPR